MPANRRFSPFGITLRRLRAARSLSQLDLAIQADTSTRHLSFLETGRANPSRAMVERLARALALSNSDLDALMRTAGYSTGAAPALSLADRAFAAATAIEDAATPGEIAGHACGVLADAGMDRFFVGAVSPAGRARRTFTWQNLGAFPAGWLNRYDAERYAATDPLIRAATDYRTGFYWDEVIDRGALAAPARAMFDAAADGGVRTGFVECVGRPDGAVRLVSLMGPGGGEHGRGARHAIQLVARAILAKLDTWQAAADDPATRATLPRG